MFKAQLAVRSLPIPEDPRLNPTTSTFINSCKDKNEDKETENGTFKKVYQSNVL